jgi:hypothetical protein
VIGMADAIRRHATAAGVWEKFREFGVPLLALVLSGIRIKP